MELYHYNKRNKGEAMRQIGIIGAGASGIMAAISAARANKQAKIILLEQKEKIGKKILATGNGRCNLTNQHMDISCYRGGNLDFVNDVLNQFGYKDTFAFFSSLGLMMKLRGEYVYPRSNQASSVLDLLKIELNRLDVQIHTEVYVEQIEKTKKGFQIYTKKKSFHVDKVILACGGKASPSLGSDGSGYSLAKSMGHKISPVFPALVQLIVEKHPFVKASGVRTDAKVIALKNRKIIAKDTGELQITAYGISGIPVFQISRYIAKGIYEKKSMQIEIDFFPELSEEMLFQHFCNSNKELSIKECMTGIINQKLIPILLQQSHIPISQKTSDLTKHQLECLVKVCKHNLLDIQNTTGFDNAQVCAGGVSLNEINPFTMESIYVEGLYFAGELLDVDGICGGYNLQWAWSTGYLAGKDAALKKI